MSSTTDSPPLNTSAKTTPPNRRPPSLTLATETQQQQQQHLPPLHQQLPLHPDSKKRFLLAQNSNFVVAPQSPGVPRSPLVVVDRGAATMLRARTLLEAVGGNNSSAASPAMQSYRREKDKASKRKFMMNIGALDDFSGEEEDEDDAPTGKALSGKALALAPKGTIVGPSGVYTKRVQLAHGAFGATHVVEWSSFSGDGHEQQQQSQLPGSVSLVTSGGGLPPALRRPKVTTAPVTRAQLAAREYQSCRRLFVCKVAYNFVSEEEQRKEQAQEEEEKMNVSTSDLSHRSIPLDIVLEKNAALAAKRRRPGGGNSVGSVAWGSSDSSSHSYHTSAATSKQNSPLLDKNNNRGAAGHRRNVGFSAFDDIEPDDDGNSNGKYDDGGDDEEPMTPPCSPGSALVSILSANSRGSSSSSGCPQRLPPPNSPGLCASRSSQSDDDAFRGGVSNSSKSSQLEKVNAFIKLQSNPDDLKSEAHILSNLAHPNIVAYCDSFIFQKQRHLILEYVAGNTLAKEIEMQQTMDMPRYTSRHVALRAVQLLLALEYLSRHGTMHRDVKPANIIITRRQLVKLVDFGFARGPGMGSGSRADELSCTRLATPDYASPEILRGHFAFTTTVDCYSAGVCIWEMFALELPYAATSIPDLLKMMKAGRFTSSFPVPPPPKEEAQKEQGGAVEDDDDVDNYFRGPEDEMDPRLVRLAVGLLAIDPAKRLTAKQALETPVMREALAVFLRHFEGLVKDSPSELDAHWLHVLQDHAEVLRRHRGVHSSVASRTQRSRELRSEMARRQSVLQASSGQSKSTKQQQHQQRSKSKEREDVPNQG